ncbi:MAG: toprim domain-containing protein [Betaproteobacteria bacterium]|nr:toprim domain-containing protein [Betaproteobacteria bacterium]
MREPIEQFRDAIRSAGLEPPEVIQADGKLRRFASNGKRGDDAGWYSLHADGIPAGCFGDWRTGFSQTWRADIGRNLTPAERAGLARQVARAKAQRQQIQRKAWAINGQRIAVLWPQCLPAVAGDPVALYLERRGLAGPVPASLRLHPRLGYWHDGDKLGTYPAMVAPLTAPDGHIVALHRTYLTPDGHKAPVPKVKKLTGAAGTLAGACIRLHDQADGMIGIAEGIETAQAVWRASGVPTVAAYCAGNLAAYVWAAGVRRIVVFADADPVGADAAQALKARALRAGLHAAVMMPASPGLDWCDVWAQRDVVAT